MTDEAVSSWRSESVQFSCGIDKRDTSSITYCFLQVRYTQVHSKELRAYGRVGKSYRHMILSESIDALRKHRVSLIPDCPLIGVHQDSR